jgi:hypothetical protein
MFSLSKVKELLLYFLYIIFNFQQTRLKLRKDEVRRKKIVKQKIFVLNPIILGTVIVLL